MTVRPVRRIRWSTAVPQMVVLALSGFALIILSVPIAGDSAGDWDLPPGVTPAIVLSAAAWVVAMVLAWRGRAPRAVLALGGLPLILLAGWLVAG